MVAFQWTLRDIISLNHMFRHKETTVADKSSSSQEEIGGVAESGVNKIPSIETAKSEPSLKELIEKNLKWSQIIYEQNRKINNKLLWSAVANWLRLLIILMLIILAFIFLPPLLKNVWSQYSDLLGNDPATNTQQNPIINLLLKWSSLDPAQQEQLKASLLK